MSGNKSEFKFVVQHMDKYLSPNTCNGPKSESESNEANSRLKKCLKCLKCENAQGNLHFQPNLVKSQCFSPLDFGVTLSAMVESVWPESRTLKLAAIAAENRLRFVQDVASGALQLHTLTQVLYIFVCSYELSRLSL
jgi:hypothetical protein